jgi:peptide/nickel transport system substrate-binding protein
MNNRRMLMFSILVLAVLLLAACSQGVPTTQPSTTGGTTGGTTAGTTGGTTAGTTGGTTDSGAPLEGETQDAISAGVVLDPALASDEAARKVNALLYEPLVKLDADGKPAGALAASWRVSDDGLEYTFYLRPGVTFSDGTPLDADAVIANFNRWFDPASELRGAATYDAWKGAFVGFKGEAGDDGKPVSTVDGMEKVDSLTVLLHLNTPDPEVLTKLADIAFSIVSPAALKAGGAAYGTSGSALGGTGPYFVAEWNDTQLVLAPNQGYWDRYPETALIFPLQ